ncbi:phosphatidylinositol-specific phospholipase C [Chitinophaga pendula]|uniref:phosphatidylinositol-specific phospholipase C n=1 Tax=Chitinophaga TaxID=79328 RepID=UPI000BAF2335|nr:MULTISPECIES: phosphatidylinositol-specific phospholipase C [Chitinophaga]ASZ12303.1 phosphatidylinositol diacylglycerol-lyase [Chitinophaga sp. MD30]UCJ10108.1 phosphatidylinositol-specific phospholipase C [Chitinophaga pendula]
MKTQRMLIATMAFVTLGAMNACQKDVQDLTPGALTKEKKQAVTTEQVWSLNNWMTSLPDNNNLAKLSIPGTHDSGARHEPLGGTAKTQTLSIREQLDAGVRFLDVRCRHIDNAFAIHHGAIYQQLNFDDVLNATISFLNANPKECVVMSIKEEHTPSNNNRSFEETFNTYVQKNPSKWYLGETIPTLGTARGKIVLVRRFGASNVKGIDVTNWADKATFSINNGNASLRVQDQYEVKNNDNKWNAITGLLSEAKSGSDTVMYLNFTSGYAPMIFGIPNITKVSDDMNGRLNNYFTAGTKGRFGIVIMDFATGDRAGKIISTNF